MNLKTITLIAIIGQAIELIYWQALSILHLYTIFGEGMMKLLGLCIALVGHGSLILFLATLYSRQK